MTKWPCESGVVTNLLRNTPLSNYKNNDEFRKAFNRLTLETWEFDYETWYKSGYWGDKCHLYSLMDGMDIVSHITVSEFDSVILGKSLRAIQLGTVMTAEQYRHKGLNKWLMDKVISEWKDKSDIVYLYANNSVLQYYPKFGFTPVSEYEAVRDAGTCKKNFSFRKLDIDTLEDFALLDTIGKQAKPLYKLSIVNNISLIMFYCKCLEVFKDNLYYVSGLNAIVVAEYEKESLIVHEILSAELINVEDAIDTLITREIKKIVLRFIPGNPEKYNLNKYKEDDLILFVSSNKAYLFDENKLIFPILSHT